VVWTQKSWLLFTKGVERFGAGTRDRNFFMYLDGPDHVTIEVQSATHHDFMHVHRGGERGRPGRHARASHTGGCQGLSGHEKTVELGPWALAGTRPRLSSSSEGMMRITLAAAGCLLVAASTLFGQAKPAFEVASIRPSADQVTGVRVGFQATGSQVRVTAMSIKDYVGIAYGTRPQQIEGPDWIGSQRFDVVATIPDGVPASQVPAMLRTLLEDRFQMKVHRESKDLPVYVLGVSKAGARLTESKPDPNTPAEPAGTVNVSGGGNSTGVGVDIGGGRSFAVADNQVQIRGMTMRDVAEVLTRFVDRVVVDQTGLTKTYDVTLELTPDEFNAIRIRSRVNAGVPLPPQAMRLLDNASPDALSAPLSKFGITFEAKKAPLDVVVIDSVLKTPTEN